MKTTSKKLDTCQFELTVTLDADEVKGVEKRVEKSFMKEVQLPGFRKGKVPLELVRKNFADSMRDETKRALVSQYYREAITAEKIDVLELDSVPELKYTAEGGEFKVIVDVKPEFKLPSYKGLKVEFRDTAVSDEVVNEHLNRLRNAYAKYDDAKEDSVVGDGDFVQIDYAGMVDGKPILEINPDAKVVASGTGFWTQVEEGRFLPELLEALKGMKVGEAKEGIKAKFDKEAAPEGLKGAKAVYTLTLKALRVRVLPTDEELVKKSGAESLEKLTADVRGHIEKQTVSMEMSRRENEVVEALLSKATFAVPPSQVRRMQDSYIQQLFERANSSGLSADYFEKNREQIMKDAEEAATKQVRVWYLIDAIAKEEKIEAGDEERGKKVIEFLLENAKK